jgi:hypothetical protein
MTDFLTLTTMFWLFYAFNALFGAALFILEVPKGSTTLLQKGLGVLLGLAWPLSFPCLIWVCLKERLEETDAAIDPNFISKVEDHGYSNTTDQK